jgi:signal transduction histidine kinase
MDEAHANLIFNLFIFNLFILLAGGVVSYVLAQRTLQPIEEAMESQSRFTADASHELRTPLTAMQTEIEVALRKRDLTAAQAKELLQSNLEEVSKLRALSENLLKLARNGDQALNLEAVSLEDISIEAMSNVVKAAQAKKMVFENNVKPLKVQADKVALAEVLKVLLDNAIKYSPKAGEVILASHQEGHNAVLTVTDKGQGISKTDLPHIFDRFYRSDQSRTKIQTEGYGLGLSIAKQLLELQGGTITVKSEQGKGSTFSVSLPLAG